jgi:crotonobetainyl-CoA:carnitine CoA-transferase CaiB-like acyl-CoA transferase
MRLDPPQIGEHTVEVLASAGLTQGEIDELIARGVAIRAFDHAFPHS